MILDIDRVKVDAFENVDNVTQTFNVKRTTLKQRVKADRIVQVILLITVIVYQILSA